MLLANNAIAVFGCATAIGLRAHEVRARGFGRIRRCSAGRALIGARLLAGYGGTACARPAVERMAAAIAGGAAGDGL